MPSIALRVTALAVALTPLAHADVIGVDALHLTTAAPPGSLDFVLATGSNFADFRQEITNAGHTIVPLSGFEAADLAGLDAVFVLQAYRPENYYSASEIAALHSFVDGGGGLVMIADAGFSGFMHIDNLNALMGRYGIEFGTFTTGGNGIGVQQWAPDPLLEGVSGLTFDFVRPIASQQWPASDLSLLGGAQDLIASARLDAASGLVVALGDGTLWQDPNFFAQASIDSADNRLFLNGVLDAVLTANTCSGASRFYGSAAAGPTGLGPDLPTLGATCPTLGSALTLAIQGGPILAPGVLVRGRQPAAVPLGNATLLLVPQFTLPHSLGAAGEWSITTTIPNNPALQGLSVLFQVGYIESSGEIAASQGLELRAGP